MEDNLAGFDVTKMSRCKEFYAMITVEPILFLYSLAGSFQWPTVDALVYRKVCLNLYNATTCDNLSTIEYAVEEDIVQSQTSHWYLANNLCFEIPSIITSFFYGNLSDQFSRKTALMLPLIGQMITLAVYFVNSVIFSLPIGCILVGPLLSGIFGGWITCNIAAYSYLSEVSTPQDRAVRIGIGESMSAISIAIGFFTSGVTLDHTSYPVVLGISFSLYTTAFLYSVFCVKDLNNVTSISDELYDEPNDPIQSEIKPPKKKGCTHIFKTLCSKESVRDSLTVIFKPREGKNRAYILILLFGMFSGILTGSASWLIGYLYLRRQPLSWTQSLYGYYVGVLAIVHGIALIAIMPLFKKVFHMTDTAILIMATVLQAVAEAFFGFCTVTWMVFLVPFVGFLSDARPTCTRAMLSTLVPKEELGKIFAVVGSLQSGGVMIASFIYNSAYPATLEYWAGLCFVAGAAFTFIPIAMFVWVHVDMRRSSQYRRLELDELDEVAAPDDDDDDVSPLNSNGDLEHELEVLLDDLCDTNGDLSNSSTHLLSVN